MDVRAMSAEAVVAATGRAHRRDEVRPRTGGPAGNATLTAWTGLLLLVLFLAELVTLLDVRGLLSWHVVVGTLLIPPALLKTASTGWRMIGYYLGNGPYHRAGPPPTLLRLLGPLVVASTLAVLGTGVTLVLAGPAVGRHSLLDVAGQHIDLLLLHKASFAGWAAATGLHVLGRAIPALRLTLLRPATPRPIPGRAGRVVLVALTAAIAVIAAILVLGQAGPWSAGAPRDFHHRPTAGVPATINAFAFASAGSGTGRKTTVRPISTGVCIMNAPRGVGSWRRSTPTCSRHSQRHLTAFTRWTTR